ncbi:hypothetical protein ACRRTK_024506 [Alexandromys fortis]
MEAKPAADRSQGAGASGRGRRHGNARVTRTFSADWKRRSCNTGCWRCRRHGAAREARAAAGRDPGRGVRALSVEGRPGHPRGDGEGAGPVLGGADGRTGAQRRVFIV